MSADPTVDPPIIWRTKLRSLKKGVNHADQVAYCLHGERVGIGWGIESLPSGTPLPDVLAAITANPEAGWGRRAASTVRLFAEEAARDDFIWTRDLQGRFRLGQITGNYRYENSAKAKQMDTHQVRKARWAEEPLGDLRVPGAVIRAFSGPSTSFSRIWNDGARIYTAWIWDLLHGHEPSPLNWSPREVLRQLEPYDLEDLVYTWMQVCEGYLALPKARRTDTPAYEWTMLHRKTYKPAIVQVKSGDQAVNLKELGEAAPDSNTTVYAFSAAERYENHSLGNTVVEIKTHDLLTFVSDHGRLLPERVRTWFELAS